MVNHLGRIPLWYRIVHRRMIMPTMLMTRPDMARPFNLSPRNPMPDATPPIGKRRTAHQNSPTTEETKPMTVAASIQVYL